MTDDIFERLDQAARSGGAQEAFDFLIRQSMDTKQYALLFQARVMKAKHALGLPLIDAGSAPDMSPELRAAFDKTFTDAAREAGNLFLSDSDIVKAWPFFRAIGEAAPVADAIERVNGGDQLDQVIEIAFHQGVNARKGFELIIEHHGICRAITFFGVYPDNASRPDALRLLVRTLYTDWSQNNYVDPSHLVSILAFSIDLEDTDTLRKIVEMGEWGRQLPEEFMLRSEPPFEDTYVDYGVYLRALLQENVDEAIAHFRNKLASDDRQTAEVLVRLLVRLGRYEEAIQVSLEYLSDDTGESACPTIFQLCQMAGAFGELRRVARERGDLLAFTAGVVQSGRAKGLSG